MHSLIASQFSSSSFRFSSAAIAKCVLSLFSSVGIEGLLLTSSSSFAWRSFAPSLREGRRKKRDGSSNAIMTSTEKKKRRMKKEKKGRRSLVFLLL
ncbi:hypothetical protein CSUI_004873 [Cystoisospora suis]|uniref:Uncharacterized protein n=1 Tax=Cystoisospora suis TaxID=483139 RepID=A0A2C6L007_9APIC|nr:hypothetical protein CSUI_004873 [Cystoisospora suis]